MRSAGSTPVDRPPNNTRDSLHSLHTILASQESVPSNQSNNFDDDDDDDGHSLHSSRSDQSLEAAGLVSRWSDEEERANRKARYEGGPRLGKSTVDAAATTIRNFRLSNEEVVTAEQTFDSNDPEGSSEERRVSSDRRNNLNRKRIGMLTRTWHIAREALPTLAISLFSLIFSGELLNHLAHWPVFTKVDKLFILIPILLNLKGNLEGNQSLRMSTSANIGELDNRRTRETLIFGNLALLQVQALIVSLFAGILAFVLGIGGDGVIVKEDHNTRRQQQLFWPRRVIHHHPKIDSSVRLRNSYFEFVLVIATAMLSASLSSAILGSFMCALIVITRQAGLNPDNIASPLAGSLGDLLTLSLLGLIGSFMVRFEGTILATMILLGLIFACVTCFIVTYRNAYVRELLSSGWIPLLIAMFISSGAGLVLDAFVQKFQGFALLTPVVTGLPGACSAIFVSRISTALHSGKKERMSNRISSSSRSTSRLRRILDNYGLTEGWIVPCTLFIIGMSIMVLFVVFVHVTGQMSFGWPFYLSFILVSGLIVFISLAVSHFITLALWKRDYDPGESPSSFILCNIQLYPPFFSPFPLLLADIYCLPYVTSLVDVIGQGLLVMAYSIAVILGDTITAAVDDSTGK